MKNNDSNPATKPNVKKTNYGTVDTEKHGTLAERSTRIHAALIVAVCVALVLFSFIVLYLNCTFVLERRLNALKGAPKVDDRCYASTPPFRKVSRMMSDAKHTVKHSYMERVSILTLFPWLRLHQSNLFISLAFVI